MKRMVVAISLGMIGGLAGCASDSESTTQPSMSDRQDAALKDPFGYSPSVADPKKAEEAAKLKKKDDGTLKGDWEKFWNP